MENMGISWQNSSGVQKDPLQILKDSGVNSVRLRVFVNPPSNFTWQKPQMKHVFWVMVIKLVWFGWRNALMLWE